MKRVRRPPTPPAQLDQVFAGSWLWGVDRPALVSFNRKDHVGPPGVPLDLVIRDLVQKETTRRPQGRITVLTQLRFMGYAWEPFREGRVGRAPPNNSA